MESYNTESALRKDGSGAHAALPSLPSDEGAGPLLVRASRDTWSRSARRKRGRADDPRSEDALQEDASGLKADTFAATAAAAAMVCVISLGVGRRGGGGGLHEGLEFRWVYGWDRALFESFASHVGRKVLLDG